MKTTLIFILFCLTISARAGYSPFGDQHWKAPVDSQGDLPATGNLVGDVRIETTDFGEYVWNGSSWVAISGGGGGVTSVTASSPLFSSGGSTPNITCQAASGSQDGCLSSSDWTAFNSKQDALNFSDSLSEAAGTVTLVNDSASPGATQYYGTDGSGVLGYHPVPFPSNSAPPGGSDTDVQYNSSGSFGGDSGFTYDGAGSVTATTFIGNLTGNADTATALASSPSQCSSGNYATGVNSDGSANCSNPNPSPLPAPSPSGDFLCTNGSNWIPCPAPSGGGGGTPGGSDTQVQYNSSGSFAGDSGFTYDGSGNVTASTFIGSLTGNASTASALAALPTSCSGNNWATGIASNGDASCSQIGFSNLSGTASLSSQVTGILPFANGGTNEASPNPSPSPSSFVAWDGNNNVSANNFIAGYATTATAGGTTTLTVDSARQQFFTGTSTQTVVLPVTSTLTTGQQFAVTNNSTTSIAVNSSGGSVVSTVAPNQTIVFTCVSTSGTDASSWNVNNNFGYVAQAQVIGTMTISGSTWVVSSTTANGMQGVATMGTPTYTPTGALSAPSTNVSGFNLTGGPGDYEITWTGAIGQNGGTACGGSSHFSITDGTQSAVDGIFAGINTNPVIGPTVTWHLHESNSVSNQLFQMEAWTDSSSCPTYMGKGQFVVKYFPDQGLAVRPDTTPASWSGNISTDSGSWTSASTTYDDPSGATTQTLHEQGNVNFGTVSLASSTLPQITFTPPTLGTIYICADAWMQITSGSNYGAYELVDGSGTQILEVGQRSAASGNYEGTTGGCGTYTVTNTSPVTLSAKLRATGSTTMSIFSSSSGTGATAGALYLTMSYGGPMVPNPVFMGSVTSTSQGQAHFEMAMVGGASSSSACTSSCTVYGSDIQWISSVTRTGTGSYTVNFTAGEFSAAPQCQCLQDGNGDVPAVGCLLGFAATTKDHALVSFYASGPTAKDEPFTISCKGPH